ncbi:MAG: hypothetical protein ACOZD0_05140 [Pseudomonadota bacterium]
MSISNTGRTLLGALALGALLASGAARADKVYWSVGIDAPQSGVSTRLSNTPPPRVMHAPPVVVYGGAPVVYGAAPVVYAPQPVYAVQPRPVVIVEPRRGHRHPHHHWDRRAHAHGWERHGGWDRWDD